MEPSTSKFPGEDTSSLPKQQLQTISFTTYSVFDFFAPQLTTW